MCLSVLSLLICYNILMEKVVLVTGGAGFIGSNLVDALLETGWQVIAVDNLITGKEENLNSAKKNKHFSFVKHDVSEPLPDLGTIDYIYHLASPASVIDYQKYPEETAKANSLGTMNILEVARKQNARFLLASTSEIYGDPKEHPQKESYWGNVNPNGIRSCYDESKRFAEMITMLYVRKYKLDARIVRIFNTYGPRMRKTDGRVISNFINQALTNAPLTVYGEGKQTRSFCYVTDLVAGLISAMTKEKTTGEVFNLGNPEEYEVVVLADKIKAMLGSSSQIVKSPLPEDDPVKRQPDISKAKKVLSWEPKVALEVGLGKTITYYKSLS